MMFRMSSDVARARKERVDYEAEYLGQLIICQLERLMQESEVSKAELARRLGCNRSKVTRMFSVGANLTLRSVAAVLVALDSRLSVTVDERAANDEPVLLGFDGARTSGETRGHRSAR